MTYKVAAYLRLSKEEYSNEKESNSITNQKLIIDNYLKEHREYKLIDYYIDDGYSGTNFDRPEFQRMLEYIKINKKQLFSIQNKVGINMVIRPFNPRKNEMICFLKGTNQLQYKNVDEI